MILVIIRKLGIVNVSTSYNNNATCELTVPLGSVKQTGPEVPLNPPHMCTTSHLLTGARTCKWQSAALLIKVWVTWKRERCDSLSSKRRFYDPIRQWAANWWRLRLWCYENYVRNHFLKKCFRTLLWNHGIAPCPYNAHRGFPCWAYRQTSPGNMTQFSAAVIWGIDTMMSLWQQVGIKTNNDNTSGKLSSQM